MELMDTVVLATPDMAMVPTPMEDMPMVATRMPMELTTERGLLTLSPRLMPMLLFCMELMDTVVLDTPDTAMVPTPMEDMPMELTTERGPLMPSPRLMLMLTMELTAMALAMLVLAMPDTAMVPTPMEDMPMVATPTPTELMLTESKLLSQSLVVKLLQTK